MSKPETITIDDVKYVRADFVPEKPEKLDGKEYCIIRTYSAGVFAAYIDRKAKGQEQTIYNAIRLWSWSGACSISQLSAEGVKNPGKCNFAMEVSEIDLRQIVEVVPCTLEAKRSITGVESWKI